MAERVLERFPWYPLPRIFSIIPDPRGGLWVILFDGKKVSIPREVAERSQKYVSWRKWAMQTRLNKAAEELADE